MFVAVGNIIVLKSDIRFVNMNYKTIRIGFIDGRIEKIIYSTPEECEKEFLQLKSKLIYKKENK